MKTLTLLELVEKERILKLKRARLGIKLQKVRGLISIAKAERWKDTTAKRADRKAKEDEYVEETDDLATFTDVNEKGEELSFDLSPTPTAEREARKARIRTRIMEYRAKKAKGQ